MNLLNKRLIGEMVLAGFVLWLIGYLLGVILFPVIPHHLIGWAIMPFGFLITVLVLRKKIHPNNSIYFIALGFCWVSIAIISDYFFLVRVFKPADGYYKFDVYVYYILTFLLPVIFGKRKLTRK